MSKFKALEKLGQKENVHRTKVGDQTSGMTAQHARNRKGASAIGTSNERKTGARIPDKKR
jgi:hypothetical protein